MRDLQKVVERLDEPDWLKTRRKTAGEIIKTFGYPHSRYTRIPDLISLLPKNMAKPKQKAENVDVIPLAELSEIEATRILTKTPNNKVEAIIEGLWTCGSLIHATEKDAHLTIETNPGIIERRIIELDENASLSLVEKISGSGNITATKTDLISNENSTFSSVTLQDTALNSTYLSINKSYLKRDATTKWTAAYLGSALTLVKNENILLGQNATSHDNELYFGEKNQHFDMSSIIVNAARNTRGNISTRGILKDTARSIAYGLIKIEENAPESNSYQSANAMLLNPGARSDAIPSLEIKTDNVKATHSATVGEIDEEQIHYLMTRGLSKESARHFLILGFLEPMIREVENKDIKQTILEFIDRKNKKSEPEKA